MKRVLIALVVPILALLRCAPASSPTLCELAANPSSFVGRQIRVEGTLMISRHGSVLEDPECDRGIAIGWDGDDDRVAKLNDAVNQRSDLPYRQGTKVRVTGEIRRVARSSTLNEPYWELRATSAQ